MKTLSIGIPAYNEEANISYLLKELLSQKTEQIVLKNIIVNSDGSTDNTAVEVRKIKNKKVILINNSQRKGRIFRQEQIMKKTTSDVLVLVDADIQINDRFFLEKITKPIIQRKADLTSVKVEELESENFLERILDTSMKLKKYIFENINNGNNLYTCHGRARAFSKKLYKIIKFNDAVAEDAFSYLYCITKGMKYEYVGSTQIFYKLPTDFNDHQKQSIRFLNSQRDLARYFGSKIVNENYHLPLVPLFFSTLKFSLRNPLSMITYISVFTYLKIKALFLNTKITWEISKSSKNLGRKKA